MSVLGGLHHIKEHRSIPYGRIATMDSIARQVVDELVEEEEQNLGARLEVLEWGSLMMVSDS